MAVPVLPLAAAPLITEEEALAQWITATLGSEANNRHLVVTGVNEVISLCETAIARLGEASTTLLQEPGHAAETIVAAGNLVHNTFHYPDPLGGPFQEAQRDLGSVIALEHAYAHRDFTAYAQALDLIPGDRTWQLWDSSHALADVQGKVALQWLGAAERETLAAGRAIRISEGLLPPEAGERVATAELRLQQATSRANQALVALHAMRDTLAELEQIVINGHRPSSSSMIDPITIGRMRAGSSLRRRDVFYPRNTPSSPSISQRNREFMQVGR